MGRFRSNLWAICTSQMGHDPFINQVENVNPANYLDLLIVATMDDYPSNWTCLGPNGGTDLNRLIEIVKGQKRF